MTDPPSDLHLEWDPSLTAGDYLDIILAQVVGDDELEDVATVGHGSNTGSFVVPLATLDAIGLSEDSIVLFTVHRRLCLSAIVV